MGTRTTGPGGLSDDGCQEILDRTPEPFVETDDGAVREETFGLRNVSQGVPHISRGRRRMTPDEAPAEDRLEACDDLEEADTFAAANVERLAADTRCVGGQEIRFNHVI